MRVVNLLFLLTLTALMAIPVVGLAQNAWRSLPVLRSTYAAHADLVSFSSVTAAIDQYVGANFGRRGTMISYDSRIRYAFGADTTRVAWGTNGFLFLKDSDVFSQVTGQRLNRAALQPLIDLAAELDADCARHGRKFVVVIPPNKHTVYRRYLPVWARTVPAVSEIDLVFDALKERNIAAVDLRRTLIERSESEPIFWRGDTHWTNLGALVGFDELARQLGLAEAVIPPETIYRGSALINRAGDLVRLAGLGEDWPDIAPRSIAPEPYGMAGLDQTMLAADDLFGAFRLSHRDEGGHAGPKVMVIGDSFSQRQFGQLFMRVASQYLWTHHRLGDFDRKQIDEFAPDIVVLEAVERTIAEFRAASPSPAK